MNRAFVGTLTCFAMLSVVAAGALRGTADAASARAARAYRQAMARLARAHSLHVTVHDALTRQDAEYWYKKPNRFKVVRSDGSRVYCDGRTLARIGADGKRTSEKAPGTFPEDAQIMDFASFYEGKPVTHELMGVDNYEFGGVTRRAYWAKTTESGIIFGQVFLNSSTMLPIGHHTSERDEETVSLYFPLVQLNPPLRDADFRPPAPGAASPPGVARTERQHR